MKDTLIAEQLEPWRKTRKRKAIATSKFYFFDVGVANHLQNSGNIEIKSKLFGDALEAFIFQELAAYRDYVAKGSLHFWRSEDRHEVDFILDDKIGIAVKGTSRLRSEDFKGLQALKSEQTMKTLIVVSLEPTGREVDGVLVLPVMTFLNRLWAGEFA